MVAWITEARDETIKNVMWEDFWKYFVFLVIYLQSAGKRSSGETVRRKNSPRFPSWQSLGYS